MVTPRQIKAMKQSAKESGRELSVKERGNRLIINEKKTKREDKKRG